MVKPQLVLFDVNETLLDLAPMGPVIGNHLGGRSDLLPLWFSMTLHYSTVETTCGGYRSFGAIGAATLAMLAERQGLKVDADSVATSLAKAFAQLPAHADVPPGLQTLRDHGFSLVALTNSSQKGMEAQLANSGLVDFFDGCYSVESVGKFKPHPAAYRHVLADRGVEPGDALMVASHAWDLAGAHSVGLQTAFIARPGCVLYPNSEHPEIVVNDLIGLAHALVVGL